MIGIEFLKSPTYVNTMKLIQIICQKQSVDESHGLNHAVQIAVHTKKALDIIPLESRPNEEEQQNVILAALLHDVDDKKYFNTQNYKNAKQILDAVQINKERKDKILKIIDLVSFSKNGNNLSHQDPLYYYYVRYADRVQAQGLTGLYRSYLYSQKTETPFYVQETPKPRNFGELLMVSQGREIQYMKNGGKSKSVIDHAFDKMLHIKLPQQLANPYFQGLFFPAYQDLVDILLRNAQNGYQNAKAELLQRAKKLIDQKLQNSKQFSELIK